MNSSSSSFSPIQSSSNPSSPRTDLPKGSADDKKAATRALYCFNSALREPEHIEALTDSLITEDFASSSYELAGEDYSARINYTDGSTVTLKMNIQDQILAMNYLPGSDAIPVNNNIIKRVFVGQLGYTLNQEFSEWVIGSVFKSNLTGITLRKAPADSIDTFGEEGAPLHFTVQVAERKTSPFQAGTNPLVQSISPDLSLQVENTVTGTIQSTGLNFTSGATLSGSQAGVPKGLTSAPRRYIYKTLYDLAKPRLDAHAPASLLPGFTEWAENKFEHPLNIEIHSFGFSQYDQDHIIVGAGSGALNHNNSTHRIAEAWSTPPVPHLQLIRNVLFPVAV